MPLRPHAMPRLILLLPDGSTRQVPVDGLPFSIGRMPGCDLVIDDPLVSRRHALIQQAGDTLRLSDLDSHNGTFVNGKRITQCALADGDRLRVAECTLRILFSDRELDAAEALRLVAAPGRLSEPERQRPASRPGG